MINKMLIICTMLATLVLIAVGIWVAFTPSGHTWPGVMLMTTGGLLSAVCVQLAREQWGSAMPRIPRSHSNAPPSKS